MIDIQKNEILFIILYCICYYFLIFDTSIGLFQLINLIQGGGSLLNAEEEQFIITNLLIDLVVLIKNPLMRKPLKRVEKVRK